MQAKMRGHLKRVGRCSVPGHGQSCCVSREIREDCITRQQEKRDWPTEFFYGDPADDLVVAEGVHGTLHVPEGFDWGYE
jgi:hypothetical protein